MLASLGPLHPSSMGYAALKQTKKGYQLSKSPDSLSVSPTENGDINLRSCQLQLITILQGSENDAATRNALAKFISNLSDSDKYDIIHFLTDIAIPAAMENNACKVFSCATADLDSIFSDNMARILSDLYKQTLTVIIPGLQTILYPLKGYDSSFDVRKSILTSFRDRVVVRLLSRNEKCLPQVHPMITGLSFITADESTEYIQFNKVADYALGKLEFNGLTKSHRLETGQKVSKFRLSEPTIKGSDYIVLKTHSGMHTLRRFSMDAPS